MHSPCRNLLIAAICAANLLMVTAAVAAPEPTSGANGDNGGQGKVRGQVSVSNTVLIGKTLDVNKPYGSHLQPILDKIQANPTQRVKITQIVESYRTKIQPLRDEYKQKRQDFLSSMTSGSAAETIMTRQVELSHLSSEISSRYTLMRLEIRRQLTPQQILQFEDYAREHGWNRRQ